MLFLTSGILYKAFRVTSLTTSRQLISEALEKCNIVQDTNLFSIYEVNGSGGMCLSVMAVEVATEMMMLVKVMSMEIGRI